MEGCRLGILLFGPRPKEIHALRAKRSFVFNAEFFEVRLGFVAQSQVVWPSCFKSFFFRERKKLFRRTRIRLVLTDFLGSRY